MDADIVVIGAGALGLSTALHCAVSGRSVAVVERHTAGSQASGRAAGPKGDDFALWCPEDLFIEEPASLIRACPAACSR